MRQENFSHNFLAAITLFFSTIYIVPLNAVIFKDIALNSEALFVGTLVLLTLGTLISANYSGVGFALAPAVGISTFLATFIEGSGLKWEYAFIACGLSGLAIFLVSQSNFRTSILDSIPFAIRLSAKSAVGALLIDTAFGTVTAEVQRLGTQIPVIIFVLGMVITFTSIWGSKKIEDVANEDSQSRALELLAKSGFILSVISCYFLITQTIEPWGALNDKNFDESISFWLWKDAVVLSGFDLPQFALTIPVFITVFFVVLTDIPGTPYELLPSNYSTKINDTMVNREEIYRKAFRADGFLVFLSPLGTTPPVFYAENYVLRVYGLYGKQIGYLFGFFGCVILALLFLAPNSWVTQSLFNIPELAFAPLLMTIGVIMIADAMLSSEERNVSKVELPKNRSFHYYLPAAFTIISTPLIGLEISFPLSFLIYYLFTSKDDRHLFLQTPLKKLQLVILTSLGVLSAMVSLVTNLLT